MPDPGRRAPGWRGGDRIADVHLAEAGVAQRAGQPAGQHRPLGSLVRDGRLEGGPQLAQHGLTDWPAGQLRGELGQLGQPALTLLGQLAQFTAAQVPVRVPQPAGELGSACISAGRCRTSALASAAACTGFFNALI